MDNLTFDNYVDRKYWNANVELFTYLNRRFLSWMVERVNYGDAKCASLSYKKLFVYVKQWKN